ncbi:MAG: hypothetical protein HY816_21170 [Candidatus Wallbacteria bacterium]|nr:hypothetical protein [Candidatus Wallbacteria bacterium]
MSAPGAVRPGWTDARALALVLLIGLLVRLPTLEEPPGCDQAVFTCIGQGILRGELPPRDLFDNKPPIYDLLWAPAGLFASTGLSFAALAELLAATLASACLFAAVRPFLGRAGSTAAALLYTLHAGGFAFGGWWTRAYPEALLDVPLAAAATLLTRPVGGLPTRAVAGALLGGALWLKPSVLPMILLLAAVPAPAGAGYLAGLAWAGAGLAAAAAAPLALLAALGLLGESWRAFVGFNAEMLVSHGAVSPVPSEWLSVVFPFATYLTALYAWSVVAVASRGPLAPIVRLPLLWWALTVASAVAQRKLFAAHYLGITAPLAWLAAVGWRRIDERMGRRAALALLAASLAPWAIATVQFGRDAGYAGRLSGRLDRAAFQDGFHWPPLGYSIAHDREAARLVRQHTPPGSRIVVFGARAGVYLWSGRPPGTRFLFNFPLVLPGGGPIARSYREQFLAGLRTRPPAMILVPEEDVGIYEPLPSLELARRWPELMAILERQYRPGPRSPGYSTWVPAATTP